MMRKGLLKMDIVNNKENKVENPESESFKSVKGELRSGN